MRVWLLAGAAAILFAFSREAAGQASITTKAGVYSQPQALRGEDAYVAYCRQCHTPESHAGTLFTATWNGRKLSELFAFIKERMPKNEPGSLSDEEYADVTAYLLKLNKMPVGKTEVSTDAGKLALIRIDLSKAIKVTKSSTTSKSSTGSKP